MFLLVSEVAVIVTEPALSTSADTAVPAKGFLIFPLPAGAHIAIFFPNPCRLRSVSSGVWAQLERFSGVMAPNIPNWCCLLEDGVGDTTACGFRDYDDVRTVYICWVPSAGLVVLR